VKLTDLDPEFVRATKNGFQEVDSIDDAQGIRFLCPACFVSNNGPIGTHLILCWSRSRGTPEDRIPLPGRWKIEGTGFNDLTLNADPPSRSRSVLLTSGCGWHGFITNGEVRNA